jgi:CRISPR-associated protein Csh1
MIKELINFTACLDEEFKTTGSLPKEGLHILLKTEVDDFGKVKIDTTNLKYEIFSKKQKEEVSDFLNHCKKLQQNVWCINTNKCFDLPTKAIHTCSPFAVAFKREHLAEGLKFKTNAGKRKQIYDRFDTYFKKANELFENKDESKKYEDFKLFFVNNTFSSFLRKIEDDFSDQRERLELQLLDMKEQLKNESDKALKQEIKKRTEIFEQQLHKVKIIDDGDYILFYLDLQLELFQQYHERYLKDKLFTVDKYNTTPGGDGLIYGTSNFMNRLNNSMPFLIHKTASFDISGRISNIDAKLLYELQNVFLNKSLPNPLPVFIYKEELQHKVLGIFKDSGFRFGYKEIIQKLVEDYDEDISNYYLLFWQNTKDGLVFKDFDFVSKFEYEISSHHLVIYNLFDIKVKGEKDPKSYNILRNIGLDPY